MHLPGQYNTKNRIESRGERLTHEVLRFHHIIAEFVLLRNIAGHGNDTSKILQDEPSLGLGILLSQLLHLVAAAAADVDEEELLRVCRLDLLDDGQQLGPVRGGVPLQLHVSVIHGELVAVLI